MAASDFGTAIYTNCAPGDGLEPTGGMQFQSRSAGVDREVLGIIRRHLIYEPPARLIQERQPVEAFPPSFAHVHDGVYATAAGVYIGREAAGSRQGNHLTQAIVASDARAYRSVRPAQMFRAPFWRTEPEATKESQRLGPSWQPGPLDAGRASQFVREEPEGTALLTAILTALQGHRTSNGDHTARRVLFISEQPEPVLLWLTAATLLIPQQEALRIGFKVFTSDPAKTSLPVVAVHPGWTRSATVEDDRGYAVFDLTNGRWTAAPESPEARHWARLFGEADPADVTEAVELAEASGISGSAARDLATAAVLRRPPPEATVREITRWLRSGPPALREAYGATLVATLVHVQDLRLLREIESITQEQFPGRRDQVRLALLGQELKSAVDNPGGFQPSGLRRPVSTAIEPEAVGLVTEALRQARMSAFDAVLRVAGRLGVSVPLGAVHEATTAFVAFWADNPEAAFDPLQWPSSPPVYDMLREELAVRVSDRPDVGDQWCDSLWRWTPDQPDITLTLDRALLSAAMAKGEEWRRLRIVRNVLGRRPDPAEDVPYRELAAVLWARTKPTVEELGELGRLVPVGTVLDSSVFAEVLSAARSDPTELRALVACGKLKERDLLELDTETARLLPYHRWLEDYESRLGSGSVAPDGDAHLREIPEKLLRAHAVYLARGLLSIDDPIRWQRLLETLPRDVVVTYLQMVHGDWQRPLWPERVAVIVAACRRLGARPLASELPPDADQRDLVCRDLQNAVIRWRGDASKADVRRVEGYLASCGIDQMVWNDYLAGARRSRPWRSRKEPDR